jgi:hypothetical protein
MSRLALPHGVLEKFASCAFGVRPVSESEKMKKVQNLGA